MAQLLHIMQERLIPASAGSTSPKSPFGASGSGSSPLARGALKGMSKEFAKNRLIPAGAGSTLFEKL
ncbi:Hypothetical protein CU7111_1886 [Corynebacterium urealyticum DSM 7111]|nr:Hypothetical protein CU7111_1886 [Corynebacterium urealyticum DSM 7111]